ncbi:MAG: hypothetical protein JXB42_10360 [Deltaproteobacteria bacterium]|nr:hypothetical protein [Deltaproteobacteria bacterium]
MQLYEATLFRNGEPFEEILVQANSSQIVEEKTNAVIVREQIENVDFMYVQKFCPVPGT